MADVSGITAIRPTSTTIFRNVLYGATVSAGQTLVYSTDKYVLADANASAVLAAGEGIAITPGVNSGYGLMATGGSIILVGATLVVGKTYVVSDTAGGIMPIDDLSSGDYSTILGTASTTTQLDLNIRASGVQVP
jgi:hypothetical protein